MSIQEARRAAFEIAISIEISKKIVWLVNPSEIARLRKGDDYSASQISSAWWAWNAALDSVVVELRESTEQGDYGSGWDHGIGSAVEAIEAAGIRVEVKS